MSQVAAVTVVAFAALLIVLSAVAFAKPAIAERLLSRFASSASKHYVEQIFRLLIGAALVMRSPAMWESTLFWIVGWAIVISSAALICVPWQWHHRFGEWMLPIVIRYLRLYAAGSLAFGVLLLYGMVAGGGAA
jgi:hypothetical protein